MTPRPILPDSLRTGLGECPVWDAAAGTLAFVDITGRAIHRYRPSDDSHERLPVAEDIGCIGLWPGGGYIAGMRTGVFRLDAQGRTSALPIDWPHAVYLWAPAGDGRIFLAGKGEAGGRPFGYLDEHDGSHDLLDLDGNLVRIMLLGSRDSCMIYDLGTDSLFVAEGAAPAGTLLYKLPLTPDGSRLRAPIQTLSLNTLHSAGNEAAVGIALMCLNSWGQGIREMAEPGDRRIVLRDEAWMQTRLGVEAVKTLDSNLRLSRNDGDVQLVTYHKPSDPLSAGDSGSQAAQIAKDLLHLADVRILLGQDEEVANELGHLLGLTRMQQELVTGWAMQDKGRALWMVGDRRFKIATVLSPIERQLTFTNEAVA